MTKQELSASLAFTGALLGAGFGSGRELWHFFARFGLWGFAGLGLAGILFMALAAWVLALARRYHCRDHRDLCRALLPRPLAALGDWLFSLFLFAGVGIMLAGGAAMAADTFGLPAVWGVALVAVPSYIAVAGRQQGVFAAQRFLVPLMLAGLAVVSAASLLQPGAAALPATAAKGQWAVAGSLYVGYNMLGGAALLTGLANNGGKPALRYRAGLLGGALVAVSAILPVAAFLHSGPEVGRYQLPLLYLAYRQSSWLFYVYSFLFAAALISTVIANSYCLCQRFAKPGRPHLLVLTLVLALALPFSQGSFARLVAQVYGACGWAGIAFFAAVALCQLGRGEKSR